MTVDATGACGIGEGETFEALRTASAAFEGNDVGLDQ
jgi:hypothetical protein